MRFNLIPFHLQKSHHDMAMEDEVNDNCRLPISRTAELSSKYFPRHLNEQRNEKFEMRSSAK